MNSVDHAVEYNKGWKEAKRLIEMGISPQAVVNVSASSSSFDIGVRDCITQFKKIGETDMLKIASVVVVIDPVTCKVLAATRRGTTDDWGFIGGKTDGEPPLEAACREFEEETGWRLIAVPEYIGCFKDEEDWDIHVYIVLDSIEAKMICNEFRAGPREIEPNILVGLVPYSELVVKTFAKFNIDLLSPILKMLI